MNEIELILSTTKFSEYQTQGLLMDGAGKSIRDFVGSSKDDVMQKAQDYARIFLDRKNESKHTVLDIADPKAAAILVAAAQAKAAAAKPAQEKKK